MIVFYTATENMIVHITFLLLHGLREKPFGSHKVYVAGQGVIFTPGNKIISGIYFKTDDQELVLNACQRCYCAVARLFTLNLIFLPFFFGKLVFPWQLS